MSCRPHTRSVTPSEIAAAADEGEASSPADGSDVRQSSADEEGRAPGRRRHRTLAGPVRGRRDLGSDSPSKAEEFHEQSLRLNPDTISSSNTVTGRHHRQLHPTHSKKGLKSLNLDLTAVDQPRSVVSQLTTPLARRVPAEIDKILGLQIHVIDACHRPARHTLHSISINYYPAKDYIKCVGVYQTIIQNYYINYYSSNYYQNAWAFNLN